MTVPAPMPLESTAIATGRCLSKYCEITVNAPNETIEFDGYWIFKEGECAISDRKLIITY